MKLTDRTVATLAAPAQGSRIVWDSEVRGFGVRITQAGVKAFVLNYRLARRERRYTIGQVPAWNVAKARDRAGELRRAIDAGIDPMTVRNAERSAPTMNEVAVRFAAEHYPTLRPTTRELYRHQLKRAILPAFGDRLVTAITQTDVIEFFGRMKERYPAGARGLLNLLSVIFNYAVQWGIRPDNPATKIKRGRSPERTRYLNSDELARLTAALDAHPCPAADILRLLLLCGSRKTETMMATWDQFDLVTGTWIKPSTATKQKRTHSVPLSPEAVAVLRRMRAENPTNHLFISARTGKPYTHDGGDLMLRDCWRRVLRTASLSNLRIHDLRHSYASFLINSGSSLAVVGGLLGHSQPQVTARYAHLLDSTLRNATNIVGKLVGGSSQGDTLDSPPKPEASSSTSIQSQRRQAASLRVRRQRVAAKRPIARADLFGD
jgi:integrase